MKPLKGRRLLAGVLAGLTLLMVVLGAALVEASR